MLGYSVVKDKSTNIETVSVILDDGEVLGAQSTHPNYDDIIAEAVMDAEDDSFRELFTPILAAAASMQRLSERVTFDGNNIRFDGDVLETELTDQIARTLVEGDKSDWEPLVLFLEKLATNPSKKSRAHLFHFVSQNGLTILPDGDVLGYKGVTHDRLSHNAGYGIVDGVEYGALDENNDVSESARLPNHDGAVVEVPRSIVDSDSEVQCSRGLHVGSYSYASTFGGGVLINVRFNPRDAVSAPTSGSAYKLRVSRYVVMGENEGEVSTPVLRSDEDEDFISFSDDEVGEVETLDGEQHRGVIPVSAAMERRGLVDEEAIKRAVEEPQVAMTGVVQPPAEGIISQELQDRVAQKLSEKKEKPSLTEDERKKVDAFKVLIKDVLLKGNESLRKHRNKRVTAKNRPLFDIAVEELGL